MPQLDPTGFMPQLVWLVITFGVLYLFLARTALPRIAEVREERASRIADDLELADKLKQDADAARVALEEALAGARSRAHDLALKTRDDLRHKAELRQAKLSEDIAEKTKAAEAEIGRAKREALAGIRDVAAEACQDILVKVSGLELDEARIRAVVELGIQSSRAGGSPLMEFGAEAWVSVALLIFIGILLWKGVHRFAASALDKRAEDIRKQLEEARSLREEAQALFARYQREQRDATQTAGDIVAQADREAKLAAETADAELEETVKRRLQMAEEKIAQAEAAAVKEVRSVAARVATAAARQLLAENLTGEKRDALVDDAIQEVDKKLH